MMCYAEPDRWRLQLLHVERLTLKRYLSCRWADDLVFRKANKKQFEKIAEQVCSWTAQKKTSQIYL